VPGRWRTRNTQTLPWRRLPRPIRGSSGVDYMQEKQAPSYQSSCAPRPYRRFQGNRAILTVSELSLQRLTRDSSTQEGAGASGTSLRPLDECGSRRDCPMLSQVGSARVISNDVVEGHSTYTERQNSPTAAGTGRCQRRQHPKNPKNPAHRNCDAWRQFGAVLACDFI
jgi:hypothetical protein